MECRERTVNQVVKFCSEDLPMETTEIRKFSRKR
jgi:hypothetical protein